MASVEDSYERAVIDGIVWYMCRHCHGCERHVADIVRHITDKHLRPTGGDVDDRRPISQSSDGHNKCLKTASSDRPLKRNTDQMSAKVVTPMSGQSSRSHADQLARQPRDSTSGQPLKRSADQISAKEREQSTSGRTSNRLSPEMREQLLRQIGSRSGQSSSRPKDQMRDNEWKQPKSSASDQSLSSSKVQPLTSLPKNPSSDQSLNSMKHQIRDQMVGHSKSSSSGESSRRPVDQTRPNELRQPTRETSGQSSRFTKTQIRHPVVSHTKSSSSGQSFSSSKHQMRDQMVGHLKPSSSCESSRRPVDQMRDNVLRQSTHKTSGHSSSTSRDQSYSHQKYSTSGQPSSSPKPQMRDQMVGHSKRSSGGEPLKRPEDQLRDNVFRRLTREKSGYSSSSSPEQPVSHPKYSTSGQSLRSPKIQLRDQMSSHPKSSTSGQSLKRPADQMRGNELRQSTHVKSGHSSSSSRDYIRDQVIRVHPKSSSSGQSLRVKCHSMNTSMKLKTKHETKSAQTVRESKPQTTTSAVTNDHKQDGGAAEEVDANDIADSKRFKCTENGCKKTFGFMKSLLIHRKKHDLKVDKTTANFTANRPTGAAIVKTFAPKVTANPWASGYLRIGNKWYKVRRLTDRSVYRHEKESHREDENYRGLQSLKRLKGWYLMDIVDGQKWYLCRYKLCAGGFCSFKTIRSQHMGRHINCSHFRNRQFPCRWPGCTKVYLSPAPLRQHELNHQCGFGILNGKVMEGVCGNKSICKHRERVIIDGVKWYRCSICRQQIKSWSATKRHIHDQHLCPVRNKLIPVDSQEIPALDAATGAETGSGDQSEPELEIVDEVVGRRRGASQEFHELISERGVQLSYSEHQFLKCRKELENLVRIMPEFERRVGHPNGRPYLCRHCGWEGKTFAAISCHLRMGHYIQ